MIKVDNLKKKFERIDSNKKKVTFYADNGISFEANDGEIVGILGPNGAGKTTLLRMVSGILEPTEGTVSFDGMTYDKHEIEIKKNIACLSGNTKLYDDLSIYELLMMCADIYEVPKKTAKVRIGEIAKKLNLEKIIHSRIANMSTGQTQKINIARCMLHDPKYYILDEATTGLDIIASQIILDFIKGERARGKTILYSTHYMEEAENICDRVVMINKGSIIEAGTPDEVKQRTGTSNLRAAFFTLIGGAENEQ